MLLGEKLRQTSRYTSRYTSRLRADILEQQPSLFYLVAISAKSL